MSLVINSTAANGTHVRITLDKTGADTGTVKTETWSPGQDPNGPPSTDASPQELVHIRTKPDGSMIVCKADITFFFQPTVTITVHDGVAPNPPFVNVTAPGHNDNYPVTAADKTNIEHFIVGCHFPPIGAP